MNAEEIKRWNKESDKLHKEHLRLVADCIQKMAAQGSQAAQIRVWFSHFPAQQATVIELTNRYNNFIWHNIRPHEDYAQKVKGISIYRMAKTLQELEGNRMAVMKKWSRGWYARNEWTTTAHIPF